MRGPPKAVYHPPRTGDHRGSYHRPSLLPKEPATKKQALFFSASHCSVTSFILLFQRSSTSFSFNLCASSSSILFFSSSFFCAVACSFRSEMVSFNVSSFLTFSFNWFVNSVHFSFRSIISLSNDEHLLFSVNNCSS